MKTKNNNRIVNKLLSFLVVMILLAMSSQSAFAVTSYVKKLSVNNEKPVILAIGDSFDIKATVSTVGKVSKTVSFSSSNKNIASVKSNGKIFAKGVGVTHIEIKTKGLNSKGKSLTKSIYVIVCDDAGDIEKLNTVFGVEDINTSNSKKQSILDITNGDYYYNPSGPIPEDVGATLSKETLNSLKGSSISKAASKVKTLGDAYAWLKLNDYSTGGINGLYKAKNTIDSKNLSWTEMSTMIGTLLEDDYDEVGTIFVGAQTDWEGWDFAYITYAYVCKNGVYYITDPVDILKNSGAPIFRLHTVVTTDLSNIVKGLREANDSISNLVTVAKFPTCIESTINIKVTNNPYAISLTNVKNVEYIYRADESSVKEYAAEKEEKASMEAQSWNERAANLKVSEYGLPSEIGNTTLTYDEAYKLVGKDPEEIAENVKTVGDVLQYMIAARFGYGNHEVYTPWYDGWGYDAAGDTQIRNNYGCCCGGYANTVSYLLEGDYEKVGVLRWIGGNHVINWVYLDGKYYVFDFTQYPCGGYYTNKNAPVTILDNLTDFYDKMPGIYPKDEMVIVVAFESGKAMYPSSWRDVPNFDSLIFPLEAKGKIITIYQKYPGEGVTYQNCNIKYTEWK